jgi:hypothetical protein
MELSLPRYLNQLPPAARESGQLSLQQRHGGGGASLGSDRQMAPAAVGHARFSAGFRSATGT